MVKEERKIVKEILRQMKNNSTFADLRKCVCNVVLQSCSISYLQKLWTNYRIEIQVFINYIYVIVVKKINKRGVNYDVDKFV